MQEENIALGTPLKFLPKRRENDVNPVTSTRERRISSRLLCLITCVILYISLALLSICLHSVILFFISHFPWQWTSTRIDMKTRKEMMKWKALSVWSIRTEFYTNVKLCLPFDGKTGHRPGNMAYEPESFWFGLVKYLLFYWTAAKRVWAYWSPK